MIAVLLLAAAASALEAERAFAAAAARDGQWTAFRAFAAPGATMFNPQPVPAATLLGALPDPRESIRWSPTASYVSCDGTLAANTGEWRGPGGAVGFFSTIWARQPDGGWKWIVDGGAALPVARAAVAEPRVRAAACTGTPPASSAKTEAPGAISARGTARDGTLEWSWVVGGDGARRFDVRLWTGARFAPVIADRIAAPRP